MPEGGRPKISGNEGGRWTQIYARRKDRRLAKGTGMEAIPILVERLRTTEIRRREVVALPRGLTSLGACMNAAANLVDIAKDETSAITERSNARELKELEGLYGDDRKSKSSRAYRAGLKELQHSQKQREKRRIMDVVDRGLMDIMSVYRDAIALQTGAEGDLVNEEIRDEVADLARRSTPEQNIRRIDAIFTAREQMMEFNTTPLLALESMMVELRIG